VKKNPEHIEAIEILLARPKEWNTGALDELRTKLNENDFGEKDLQKAYRHVYKKPLADIISMIKHAAELESAILNAKERVEAAIERITESKAFSEKQMKWLAYIKQHLIENLAIAEDDFDIMPIFERHGGLRVAKKIFSENFDTLINELNEAVAA